MQGSHTAQCPGLNIRSINRLSILDRAHRRTTPYMHRNQTRPVHRFCQGLCNRPQNERVTDPVEPILAEFVPLGCFLVYRIGLDVRRHGLVEGGVEEGDALDVREFFST